MARQFSVTRYNDPDYREPATFLLLSVFIYFAGYLGGVTFARSGSRLEKLAAFSGVVPALLETFVIGARTGFISFVICWIASYLATRAYMGERRLWLSWRRALATLASGLIALTILYVMVQVMRMSGTFDPGPDSIATTEGQEILLKFSVGSARIQFVGYAPAFSRWFTENWDVWQAPGLGLNSFDGPAGWLGYKITRNPEEINLTPYANKSIADRTNVYSTLRQMALDWTLPGSSIFLLILSALASLAYVEVCGRNAGYIPLIVLYYQIAMYVTGFALRNTVTDAAWVLFACYLWVVSGAELRGYLADS